MKTNGNTILITGGATGIGLSLAERFLAENNEVIVCGRRKEKLEEAKQKFPKLHIKVCDVSKEIERTELVEWAIKNFPSFNVLVNNAGIQQMIVLPKENSAENITNEVNTNLVAPIHFTELVAEHFSKQPGAAILNITSGLGFVPIAFTPVYCATKAALHSFSMSARRQFRDTPVKIFEIIPPMVDTDLDKGSREKRGMKERGIKPEVVAEETLKALASDQYEFP